MNETVAVNNLYKLRELDTCLLADTSEGISVYLLRSQSGHYIRLSPSAYWLADQIRAGLSIEEVASRASERMGRVVDPHEVERAVNHVAQCITTADSSASSRGRHFWIRMPLLSATRVNQLSSFFLPLFQPGTSIIALGFIGTAIWFGAHLGLLQGIHFGGADVLLGYALFLISLMGHEFGHASACLRFGAQPSEIGFGAYYIFPVFFSDVSAAWQLKRWKRVIVDCAGVYVQGIVGALYLGIYMMSGWEPLRVALIFLLSSCIFALNPILKFDGYWFLADALGVTNLGQQPLRILRYIVARVRGKYVKPLPWPAWIIVTLAIYTVLTGAFWVYVLLIVLPALWIQVVQYPTLVAEIVQTIWLLPPDGVIEQILALLSSTFIVCIALLMCFRLVSMVLTLLCTTVLYIVQRIRNKC